MAKRKVTKRKNKIEYNELPKMETSTNRPFPPDFVGSIRNETTANKTISELPLPYRASERASIFIDDCRVFVRNLTDPKLIQEHFRIISRIQELRRELESLENVSHQFWKEKEFRKL